MTQTDGSLGVADIRRAAAVAREYDALMGLSFVALGVGFLLAGLLAQPAVWIALGSAFSALSAGWYHKHYGFARPHRSRTLLMAVGAVVAVIVLLVAYVLDRWLAPPVSLSLLAVALVLGLGQWLSARRIGLTPVHWVVYALVLLAAFAPVIGVGRPVGMGHGPSLTPYVSAVTGVALIVVGVVDHLRLTRLLAPVAEPSTPARTDDRH